MKNIFKKNTKCINPNSLSEAIENTLYKITKIQNVSEEFRDFLISIGFYEGENITLISALGNTYIIEIKNIKYSINKKLASNVIVDLIKN